MTGTAARVDTGSSLERILCAVDLSDFSAPVLAHATALARRFEAEVTALHVFAAWVPPPTLATYPGWMLQIPEARDAIGQEIRALIEPFDGPGMRIALRTAEGDAAAEIVRAAAEIRADMVVVGTHGRSGFDRFALGSVTEKVLRKARCPVLTLPPGAARTTDTVRYRQILCPTDFHDSSNQAIDFAIWLALKMEARLTALHVVDAPELEEPPSAPAHELTAVRQQQHAAATRVLHESVARYQALPVDLRELVLVGKPHREIVRAAIDGHADVIVMGARGRGPMDFGLFGSTANQVVRQATCPVITCRS
ncbi:MAG TPA: universal stress protein [Vicinamibacterales bacterium]|nr:universal stress protein [Vicinamibacterales bacterium]